MYKAPTFLVTHAACEEPRQREVGIKPTPSSFSANTLCLKYFFWRAAPVASLQSDEAGDARLALA